MLKNTVLQTKEVWKGYREESGAFYPAGIALAFCWIFFAWIE